MKSKLEELIEKLCPNGVEYRELEKIITIISPPKKILSKNITLQGKYPVIDQGADYISGYTDDTEALLSDNNYIIFGDHTETIKYVDFKFAQGADGIKILVTKDFHCKYLYYCFTNFYEPTGKYTRHWSKAKTTLIPLPPLEIQEEIVRILDKFTELTTELTAELTLRKQQYEHYRDELLTFGDEVEWKSLGEVLKIKNGKDYKKYNIGEIPVYGSGGVIAYIDTFVFDKASVLIPRKGSIDKLYYVDKPFWTVDTIFYTEIKENIVIPKFVFYYLQKEHLEKYNTAGGVPSLTQSVLNRIPIPVPSLEEQKRIVEILDRFDKYINDIKEGLPAEIEMRQKQYEYYRDKLLNFKKLNVEG